VQRWLLLLRNSSVTVAFLVLFAVFVFVVELIVPQWFWLLLRSRQQLCPCCWELLLLVLCTSLCCCQRHNSNNTVAQQMHNNATPAKTLLWLRAALVSYGNAQQCATAAKVRSTSSTAKGLAAFC
jgi:hypothetical protein